MAASKQRCLFVCLLLVVEAATKFYKENGQSINKTNKAAAAAKADRPKGLDRCLYSYRNSKLVATCSYAPVYGIHLIHL